MAAEWVQAICITRAHSTSSWGFAPSMKANLAFTAVSEIPLFGSRAAAISCCSEASTNALFKTDGNHRYSWIKNKRPCS